MRYDMFMRSRFFITLAGSLAILALSGCSYFGLNHQPIFTNYNPADILQRQSASLDGSLQLETDLRNLFDQKVVTTGDYTYPIAEYTIQRTQKIFGQYIAPDSGDRFTGYHTGDDIEVPDKTVEISVYVLTDASMVRKETVAGYGGVVILEFIDQGQTYHALYGHLDIASVTAAVGDTVHRGAVLGNLGDDASAETDGERKHLHFGLYPYTGTELFTGYVDNDADLALWVNPADWLRQHGAVAPTAP